MRRFVKASSDAAMSGSTVVAPFGLPPQAANNARMAERVAGRMVCRLTLKLRGRTETPEGAEGAQFLSARGAKPTPPHGPLQRLLGVRNLLCLYFENIPPLLVLPKKP